MQEQDAIISTFSSYIYTNIIKKVLKHKQVNNVKIRFNICGLQWMKDCYVTLCCIEQDDALMIMEGQLYKMRVRS